MGGKGSGSLPDNPHWRGGRKKKTSVQVAGSGVPTIPSWLPEQAYPYWHEIVEVTSGVTFLQDSGAIAELASLTWRQAEVVKLLTADPANDDLNRISLAIGRQSRSLWEAFGLTPRSRQVLVVPTEEVEELDELEKLQQFGT